MISSLVAVAVILLGVYGYTDPRRGTGANSR